MKEKRLGIFAIAAMVLLLAIGVFTRLAENVYLLGSVDSVICPLLFLAAVICAYFTLKDKTAYTGKGIWVVIALQAGLAIRCLMWAPYYVIAVKEVDMEILLPIALSAIGGGLFVAALLKKGWDNVLLAGLGVLAAGQLFGTNYVACVVYVLLLVIATGKWEKANKILRTIAVVLAAVTAAANVFAAVSMIIFAYILVPAEKKALRLNLAKITAVVCALAAVAALVFFVIGEPMSGVKYTQDKIDNTKENITFYEERLQTLTEDLTKYETELAVAKESLVAAEVALAEAQADYDAAKANLTDAEAALDLICLRSYYSTWLCTEECLPLHNTVTNVKNTVTTASTVLGERESEKNTLERQISNLENNIEDTKYQMEMVEENLLQLEKQLEDLCKQLSAEYFNLAMTCVALLLAMYGLYCFVVGFFKETYDTNFLLGCGALALSSLLAILLQGRVTISNLISSPYAWGIVAPACFAALSAKKTTKPNALRAVTVIAALVMSGLAVANGYAAVFGLFAVAMICGAFALVPLVFTEYICIAKHLFLSLITCGIWSMVWIYNVTKNLNKVNGAEQRKPCRELLLCLFLPFYTIYWLLKTGENVEAYGKENGKAFKLDILCLVFAFICPLIASVLIQNKINAIVGKPE